MTVIKSSSVRRSNGHHDMYRHGSSTSFIARLLLILACIWPLFYILLASTTINDTNNDASSSSDMAVGGGGRGSVSRRAASTAALRFRDLLDRVDIMGYGPTHPRVAVVIVGNNKDNIKLTVESVFTNTDMNRIFIAIVVADGITEDPNFTESLQKFDTGTAPHWHESKPDVHVHESGDDEHGQKVHVMYNDDAMGLAECRKDAIDFIRILEKKHLQAGLKSEAEDLILLLLQSGAQLSNRKWLLAVTEALIVPPPLLGKGDSKTIAMKLANAVAFNLNGSGRRDSFDVTFAPLISQPTAEQLALSNGESYPTPALNGAGVAMRLDTYLNLPSQDLSLKDDYAVNLDLALNLWLCADGIDMLRDLDILSFGGGKVRPSGSLPPNMAARFAAAWMDDITQKRFFNAYTKIITQVTYLEWQTFMSVAVAEPHFSRDLSQKCRSFQWYLHEVNTDWPDFNTVSVEVPQVQLEKADGKASDQKDGSDKVGEKREDGIVKEGERHEDDGPDLSKPRYDDRKMPSEPLCDECLKIIQQAVPYDLKYVDVADGYRGHPHKGALDELGRVGYVHNETALRLNPPKNSFTPDMLAPLCDIRDNNYRMLTEKVYVDMEYEKTMTDSKRDKIFCLVYTIDAFHKKIPAIHETWGPKCDGFMVASNKTDVSLGTVNILHDGPEEYNNIWQKVRSMWSYVYDNYYDTYDWFHIGGDDLYLIVENFRYYLESEEIKTAANGGIFLPTGMETKQIPLFLGRRFAYQGDMNEIFNSGGSGYTMNKAALKLLVVDGFTNYFQHMKTFSEDTMVARVFKQYNVFPYETKDKSGGERYMPFLPGHHYGYRLPKSSDTDWYAKYSINIKEGVDHCAARSIAFHYVKDAAMMNRLHALLYHTCPTDTQS